MLAWFILAPIAGLALLNLPGAGLLRKRALTLAGFFALAEAIVALVWPGAMLADPQILGLELAAGSLTRVMMLSTAIALFAAAMVARSMIDAAQPPSTVSNRASNFASLLLLCLAGMNGVVLVTDLFSLYVFLEITSVASFILIAFNRDRGGLEGAFKYLILSAVATALMLGSVAFLLLLAGGTKFSVVAAALAGGQNAAFARVAVALFAAGLFIKAGLVPFHGWVLGAYSAAPAAVSVLLAGVVTKVSGLYALFRLAGNVFPHSDKLNAAMMLIGVVTIAVGAFAAIGQKDVKRMLAFSSVSQMGYIVLGLGCGTPLAIAAAVFHLFNHAIFKSLLFTNAAALETQLGTTDMSAMGGLGARMPVTSVTACIAALSTSGVPPFSGFWSKLLLVVALWQAGYSTYAMLAVGLSVVTLGYFLVLQRRVFFGTLAEGLGQVREAGFDFVATAIILAAATTGIGLLFPLIARTFLLPTGGLM